MSSRVGGQPFGWTDRREILKRESRQDGQGAPILVNHLNMSASSAEASTSASSLTGEYSAERVRPQTRPRTWSRMTPAARMEAKLED